MSLNDYKKDDKMNTLLIYLAIILVLYFYYCHGGFLMLMSGCRKPYTIHPLTTHPLIHLLTPFYLPPLHFLLLYLATDDW